MLAGYLATMFWLPVPDSCCTRRHDMHSTDECRGSKIRAAAVIRGESVLLLPRPERMRRVEADKLQMGRRKQASDGHLT